MYYPINENTARLSHQMMSMSDYKEGSATAGYRAAVDEAAEQRTVQRGARALRDGLAPLGQREFHTRIAYVHDQIHNPRSVR